jgi:hypothetical protein
MLQMFHRVYQMIQNFKFYIAVVLCHQALFSLIKRPQLNALDLNDIEYFVVLLFISWKIKKGFRKHQYNIDQLNDFEQLWI